LTSPGLFDIALDLDSLHAQSSYGNGIGIRLEMFTISGVAM
jgi:hypothetical protein